MTSAKILPSKKILFTILNWGLGHATRSIPLIKHLLTQDVEIVLASDGRAKALLEQEFPHLECIELPAYQINYGGKNMVWSIAKQLPKITTAVLKEHRQTQAIIKQYQIDGIISDNRFGTYSNRIPSVIITHQINILTPYEWLNPFARFLNRFWLKKYDMVWIPDNEGKPNLSGVLSHGVPLERVEYLGVLARMKKENLPIKYGLIAVLSGPEPQRSLLEEKIIHQIRKVDSPYLIVQGKTESFAERQIGKQGQITSYLTSKDLNQAINESKVVIARSGYSTVMDLAILGKRAILIPTPLQTEQEYLADNLSKQNIFVVQAQDQFNLEDALQKIPYTTGFQSNFDGCQYKWVLDEWVGTL